MPKINEISLKTLITVDALTCTAMGVVLLFASAPISAITHIPQALLHWAGLSLLPIAAFMAITAAASAPRWAVNLVILGNLLWAIASIILPAGGFIIPNPAGWFFLIGQAALVVLLSKLELDAARSPLTTA
jgi:hypothetical protein